MSESSDKVRNYVNLRDILQRRIDNLTIILTKDEIEVRAHDPNPENEVYVSNIPKEDFETLIQDRIDTLTALVAAMDTKIDTWASEIGS